VRASTTVVNSRQPWGWLGIRYNFLYILLFSVLTQIVFLAVIPGGHRENESSDYTTFYARVAQNLLDGKGLVTSDGKIASDYPPGFPVYLAAHFYLADRLALARDSLITATNILLMSLSCLLVGWIAESLFTRNIAAVSAVLWATYLFNLWLVKQPNSEVPFIFLFYLAICFFLRGVSSPKIVWFALVGLLLGLAALIRPIILFLPFVLAVLLLLYREIRLRHRLSCAALIIAAFLVVILPWEAKLGLQTGRLVPLSTNGPASILDGLTFATKTGKGGDHAWVPAHVQTLAQRVRENQHSLHTTGEVIGFMFSQMLNDPGSVIEMGILKTARSWYGTNAMWHERPVAIIQLVYLLLIAPGIYLAWQRFPTKRFLCLSLLATVLYFWGMTVIVLSILRYMVPAIGFLLIFAAVSLDTILARRTPAEF